MLRGGGKELAARGAGSGILTANRWRKTTVLESRPAGSKGLEDGLSRKIKKART